jgi:hypothetical protein
MLDYVHNIFPSVSEEMLTYYRDLEKAVGLLLRFSDWRYRIAQQEPKEDLMLKVGEALSRIEGLQARLEGLAARLTMQENQRLQKERSILEVTRLFVSSLKNSMLGKKEPYGKQLQGSPPSPHQGGGRFGENDGLSDDG